MCRGIYERLNGHGDVELEESVYAGKCNEGACESVHLFAPAHLATKFENHLCSMGRFRWDSRGRFVLL